MKISFCLIFFAVLVTSTFGQHEGHDHSHEQHRVNVAVYYESLCPDSIKFVTTQLYPSLQGKLGEFVNLTLIPYGRSTSRFDGNQYEFTCRHGPQECEENKLHLCAMKRVDTGRPTMGLGYNKKTVGFINCLMKETKNAANNTTFPTKMCATSYDVNNLVDIENCANHPDGSNYLSAAGKDTEALVPPLGGVPRIIFNQKYNEDDNQLAQSNFPKALCKFIDHDKPEECSKSGARFATGISTVLLLVSVLYNLI